MKKALHLLTIGLVVLLASCTSNTNKYKLNQEPGWYFIMKTDSVPAGTEKDGFYHFDEHHVSYMSVKQWEGNQAIRIYENDEHEIIDGQYKYLRLSSTPNTLFYCLYYPSQEELNTGESPEDQTAKQQQLKEQRNQLLELGLLK